MKISKSTINKLLLTGIKHLDPVSVYLEDFGPGRGKIIIECFGNSWSSFWPAMGDCGIADFFLSCDNDYLTKNLSSISPTVPDIDAIRDQAKSRGVDCWRDDPWNDYEFMQQMYGPDPTEWDYQIPEKENPDYAYLCRIIDTVKYGLLQGGMTGGYRGPRMDLLSVPTDAGVGVRWGYDDA